MYTHRSIPPVGRGLSCLAAILSLALILTPPMSAQSAPATTTKTCSACSNYGLNQHYMITQEGDLTGTHTYPLSPLCPGPHVTCNVSYLPEKNLHDLVQRLSNARPTDIPALLGSLHERVTINWSRGLIQLRGCSGQIVASAPMSTMGLVVAEAVADVHLPPGA